MESGSSASPSHSTRTAGRTKYGKSCVNCSKAKCKCNYLPGRSSCERCDRLNKQCKPLVSVRRGETQDTEPASHTSNDDLINVKLDQLISLLKARRENAASVLDVETQELENSSPSETPEGSFSLPLHLRLDPTAMSELTDNVTAATTFSALNLPSQDSQTKRIVIPKLLIAPEQITRCFRRFRTTMLPWLPFMYVPESMTVAEVEMEYPLLHLCISVTAAVSTSQLHDWSEKFRQTVVAKVYDAGERSLDLVLAIIAFLGWLRHHRQERPFFNLWLHMAMTLISDLGLDKRAQGDNTWWPWHRESVASEQSIIEKRVVLAVFILTSTSASSIKSADSLQWTPHMDDCLQSLEDFPEWYGDRVLAIQARCCLITESLNRLTQPLSHLLPTFEKDTLFATTLHQKSTHIAALEMQLASIKSKVQNYGLEQNITIAMCVIVTELDIHESAANPETPLDDHGLTVSENLSRYSSQLTCLKDWWQILLSINPDQFPDASFSVLTQLIHCIVSLFRLTTLPRPDWDRLLVRSTADIIEYLEAFAVIAETGHSQVGLICDRSDDILQKTVKTMRKLKQFFLNIMIMNDLTSSSADQLAYDFNESVPDMMDLDYWSNQWLSDIIVSWEK